MDKDGISVLLWKPFAEDVSPPRWIRRRKAPNVVPDKVCVTVFANGWCPAQNMVAERARRAAAEFKENVVFTEMDTSDRGVFLEYGISDALFIDDKAIRTGPPPSYEKIRRQILKRVRRLRPS